MNHGYHTDCPMQKSLNQWCLLYSIVVQLSLLLNHIHAGCGKLSLWVDCGTCGVNSNMDLTPMVMLKLHVPYGGDEIGILAL
jgi:hypothetical protein